MKLSKTEFDRIVTRAIQRIPVEIRQHLDNILISVQRRPSKDLLAEMGMPPDELLLGIFEGTALPERSITEPPLYPDTIFLFQGPLEEICGTVSELEEQIEITVAHEIAHYLGLSDEELAKLGYD
jgi:predicted Zn-dependent protease with MMP-like domain